MTYLAYLAYLTSLPLMACLLLGALPAVAGELAPQGRWVGAWSTAQLPQEVAMVERTVRMRVKPATGGERFRLRISNAVGKGVVTVRNVHIGIAAEGANIVPGTNQRVTFHHGLTELQLPIGAELFSDPIDLPVADGDVLSVSMFLPGVHQSIAGHARGDTYATPDNHTDLSLQEHDSGFVERQGRWFYLSALEVWREDPRGVLVAIGDSITDGHGAPLLQSWPSQLNRRVQADAGAPIQAVLNAGIGSNRLLGDGCWVGGPRLLNRLVRDVITQPQVSDVVVLIGTNDIAVPSPSSLRSAQSIIEGLAQAASMLKAAGLHVIGATILPSKEGNPWATHGDPHAIGVRNEVNDWIRKGKVFDDVIDFAAITADPEDPDRLNPKYDSGDGLHPNAAGYEAMAGSFDLGMFRGVRAEPSRRTLAPDPAEACDPPL